MALEKMEVLERLNSWDFHLRGLEELWRKEYHYSDDDHYYCYHYCYDHVADHCHLNDHVDY